MKTVRIKYETPSIIRKEIKKQREFFNEYHDKRIKNVLSLKRTKKIFKKTRNIIGWLK